ncbi:MAG: GIY-YIG nuclease family protein, partial [Rickettsiales bacterium]|nr:GIY-YIG nuclease family protein [Rickettsiales bacterium]
MKKTGAEVIAEFQRSAPDTPGVYRMFAADGSLLYVGKAKNLAARIKNYTEIYALSDRIAKMAGETARMEILATPTENEALLLEQDLIKRLKPKYNILMRDDKSYPFMAISKDEWPRLYKFRGTKNTKAHFFGPFPSGLALNEAMRAMESAFRIRTCSNAYFANRSRPCLLWQIKKCSAPCSGRIGRDDYAAAVASAIAFLKGKERGLLDELGRLMQKSAGERDFESAIFYRDQIAHLNQMLKRSSLANVGKNTDIIALVRAGDEAAVEVLFSRNF